MMRVALSCAALLYLATLVTLAKPSGHTVQAPAAQRFDFEVRSDFFAGFAGDQARLARAMKKCEDTLAANANHAEALVWHGGGLTFQAGTAFRQGDWQTGTQLWTRGLAEMDRAVSLSPDAIGVRIPRGATLLEATRHLPDKNEAAQLLRLAVGDYEAALALQEPYFTTLSGHARGELLFGIAEGWQRLGEATKSRAWFERVVRDAADSPRVEYARLALDGRAPAKVPPCAGCH